MATRAEVEESVRTGLPTLEGMCTRNEEFLALAEMSAVLAGIYPAV